jgi:arylsulfatase A-like enzyme
VSVSPEVQKMRPRSNVDEARAATRLRRLGAGILAFACAFPPTDPARAAGPSRPNIVFILADDLGYMDIGANNPRTFYETPHIDGLARTGMRFTAGYAACSVCSPTRASIMTGKYPPRTGVTDWIGGVRAGKLLPAPNRDHLGLEEITIAERLRGDGYATFFAGKWHLGAGEYSPNAQGFGPGLTGSGQFFYPPSRTSPPASTVDPKTTDRIADAAVAFIEERAGLPGSFFAYLPFLAVHTPIGARADLVAKYEKKKESAPADSWGKERDSVVRLVQNHPVYAAMMEQLDTAIGRVLAAIDRAGLGERTIVVFTSDNGGLSTTASPPTSNVPLRGGKGWPYEGGVRTPWIVRAPGVTRPGSLCDTPVITTDFYPTLLALAGLPLDPSQHRDGIDLGPLLRGDSLDRGPLFWHYPHYGNQGGAPCATARDGDWKLIEWYEDGRRELYNVRDDPSEARDLASREPGRVEALQAKLDAWRKDVGAILPTPNPGYRSGPATPKTRAAPKAKTERQDRREGASVHPGGTP